MVVVPLLVETKSGAVGGDDLVVGIHAVVEAVEGVGPGCFEEGPGSDGVVFDGLAEHGVGAVVGDRDGAGSDCV